MNIKHIALASLFCTMSLHVVAGQSAPPGLQGNMPGVTSGTKVETPSTITSDNQKVTLKILSPPGELPEVSLETRGDAPDAASSPPATEVTMTVNVKDAGGNIVDSFVSQHGFASDTSKEVKQLYREKYPDGAWY